MLWCCDSGEALLPTPVVSLGNLRSYGRPPIVSTDVVDYNTTTCYLLTVVKRTKCSTLPGGQRQIDATDIIAG